MNPIWFIYFANIYKEWDSFLKIYRSIMIRAQAKLDKDSSHAGMKAIAILIQLSKCWDFLWDFRFNDVIPRSCDQIFFSKSDIHCQTCPIPQQIYIYVLIIYTKDNSFLDYAR